MEKSQNLIGEAPGVLAEEARRGGRLVPNSGPMVRVIDSHGPSSIFLVDYTSVMGHALVGGTEVFLEVDGVT
ncbi:MAG: hypothetical protein ACREV3_11880 [Gammaproteobacteria bacterium]